MPRLPKGFRFRLLAVVLIALVMIYSLLPWWDSWSANWGNQASFAKIRREMTIEEVEAILTGPAGNNTTKPALVGFGTSGPRIVAGEAGGSARRGYTDFNWNFEDGTARVRFDPDGKVFSKLWDSREAQGPLEVLVRKIGL